MTATPDVQAGRRLYDFSGVDDGDVIRALMQRALHQQGEEGLDIHLQSVGALAWLEINDDELSLVSSHQEHRLNDFFSTDSAHGARICAWQLQQRVAPIIRVSAIKQGIVLPEDWYPSCNPETWCDLSDLYPAAADDYDGRLSDICSTMGLTLPRLALDVSAENLMQHNDTQLLASVFLYLKQTRCFAPATLSSQLVEHVANAFSQSSSPVWKEYAEAFRAAA